MTTRLDQLRFPDETKVGLTLLVGYMLLDASQTFSLGGWHALKWLTGSDPSLRQAGLLQLFILVALSMALMAWRIRFSLKGLQLRRIEEADERASRETGYLGTRIARGRAKFFVTANMGDTNAFCMWTGSTPWVVLGGGLRLLFRKEAARAQAIVGHECAHVDAGDTQYVLVSWHVFNAYALLTIGYLVITQAQFWMRVPEVLPEFQRSGLGLIDLLRQNVVYVFRNGFPGLIALAGVAFALRHLVRLREYRADERAAQAGLRTPLIDTLNALAQQSSRPGWRQLFVFHPKAAERAKRLADEKHWARSDLLFIATLAFLAARIDEHLAAAPAGPRPPTETIHDALAVVQGYFATHPMSALHVAIPVALLFIAVVNVYRATATQVKLGATLRRRLPVALPAFTALFIGSLVGDLTSWGQLVRLSDLSTPWTVANAIDSAFTNAALAAMVGAFLLVGVALVAPRMLKHARKPGWGQLWKLSWWTLLAASILQVATNAVSGIIGLLIGGRIGSWNVSWLPTATQQIVPGVPSLFQVFVFTGLAFATLQALKLLPGKAAEGCATKVEASWLVKE